MPCAIFHLSCSFFLRPEIFAFEIFVFLSSRLHLHVVRVFSASPVPIVPLLLMLFYCLPSPPSLFDRFFISLTLLSFRIVLWYSPSAFYSHFVFLVIFDLAVQLFPCFFSSPYFLSSPTDRLMISFFVHAKSVSLSFPSPMIDDLLPS